MFEGHQKPLEHPRRVFGLAADLLPALLLADDVLDQGLAAGQGVQLLVADIDRRRDPRHGRDDLLKNEQIQGLALLEVVGHELRERGDLDVPLRPTDDARKEREELEPLLEVDAVFLEFALAARQLLDDRVGEHVERHRRQVLEGLRDGRDHPGHAHDLPQQLPADDERVGVCYFGQQTSDRPHGLPGVFVVGGRRHPAQDPPRLCLCQLLRRLQQRRARDELAELCIQTEPLRVRQLGQRVGPQRAGNGHVGRHQVVGRQERAEQQLLAELFLARIPAADQSADRSEHFRKRPQVEVQVLPEQGDRSHGPLAELRAIGLGTGTGTGTGTGGASELVAYDGAQRTSDALARGHVADPVVAEVLHEQHGIVPRAARQQVAQKLQPLVVAADDVSKGIGV